MIADLDPNPPNKTLTRAVDRLRALDGRAALVVVVVAVLAVALGGWTMWHSRPHAVEVGPALATAAPHRIRSVVPLDRVPAPPAPNNSAPPANLVVDVEGKVRHPGVVAVAPGSRVGDALQAAGGPMPGVPTTSVNLAEPLSDGQQIVLGEPAPAAPGGTTRGRGRRGWMSPARQHCALVACAEHRSLL
jgi:competence protein ComEA